MFSSFTEWNKQKYDEYIHKSNEFTDVTLPSQLDTDACESQRLDNFYSLPGISLSDENDDIRSSTNIYYDANEANKYRRTKFGYLSNKFTHKAFVNSTYAPSQPYLFSEERKNDDCPKYSKAASNLKLYLDYIKQSKSYNYSFIPKDFRKVILNEEFSSDKCVQTKESKYEKFDKSNQTVRIKTKTESISTDLFLMQKWFEENERKKLDNAVSSNGDVEKLAAILVAGKREPENSKIRKPRSPSLKSRKTEMSDKSNKNGSDPDHSINETTLSNLDESTVISKSNSRFTTFNNILENIGLHLKNHDISKNSGGTKNKSLESSIISFWENPLDHVKWKIEESVNGDDSKSVFESGRKRLRSFVINKKNAKQKSDTWFSKDTESNNSSKFRKSKSLALRNLSGNEGGDVITNPVEMKICKEFYLNPYDDLIKSHFSPFDRRLKSVSSKNKSQITIEGPLQVTNASSNAATQGSLVYRCSVRSSCQENLDKCINYLKETFPQSYLKSKIKKDSSV